MSNKTDLIQQMVNKFIGFIFLGCCGLKEIQLSSSNSPLIENILDEFSFKYAMLVYLKEELAFIKNKSYEYYSKAEELLTVSLFSENSKQNIDLLVENQDFLDKYKYVALNLCSELYDLVDNLPLANNKKVDNVKENTMKNFIKTIYAEIEDLSKI